VIINLLEDIVLRYPVWILGQWVVTASCAIQFSLEVSGWWKLMCKKWKHCIEEAAVENNGV
jgi:hypothetical protein